MPQSVLVVGNFDGVHRGHQMIVSRARELADAHDARVVVVTFHPHPASVLRPGMTPPKLGSIQQRRDWLKKAGADDVHVIDPEQGVLELSPREFVQSMVDRHDPVAFVEGQGFRFGQGRQGDLRTLTFLGYEMGFAVHEIEPMVMSLTSPAEVRVSSTLIRHMIGHGRVLDAQRLLGRYFSLTTPVVQGEQRGRTIGVPTANLDSKTLEQYIVPADGVYAGSAILPDYPGLGTFSAAISVGHKPTFGKRALIVEAHLIGLTFEQLQELPGQALYGQTIELSFARWIRDQYPFPSVEHLRAQLQRDIASVG